MRVAMLAAASVAFLSAASSAWALTPLSGFLQAQTHAFANGGALVDTDTQTANWTGTPQDRSTFFESEVGFNYGDGDLSIASAAVNDLATWSGDGASGSVELTWRWNFATFGAPDTTLRGASYDGLNPNWSYTFRADNDGVFRWQGQIRPSTLSDNDPFGLSGWNLQLNGVTVIDLFDTSGAGPRQGDQDFALVAGETYTFSLVNNSNITGSNFDRTYRGEMLGEFYWDIVETPTTVPEPSAWAMMILGFALTGVAVRLRRRQVAIIRV